MTWRERQAFLGPRARWAFVSVVPCFVDAETGAKIEGLPAPGQKWRLHWPRKGAGQTYRKYPKGWSRRSARDARRDQGISDLCLSRFGR